MKVRYPLELVVHYQTLGEQAVSGAGRTLNLSSSGAYITAEHEMEEGARLKITIEWPTLLNGSTPLQLVTTGKVVRSEQQHVAFAFDWYQFRTMGRSKSVEHVMAASVSGAPVSRDLTEKAMPGKRSSKTVEAMPLRNVG